MTMSPRMPTPAGAGSREMIASPIRIPEGPSDQGVLKTGKNAPHPLRGMMGCYSPPATIMGRRRRGKRGGEVEASYSSPFRPCMSSCSPTPR